MYQFPVSLLDLIVVELNVKLDEYKFYDVGMNFQEFLRYSFVCM